MLSAVAATWQHLHSLATVPIHTLSCPLPQLGLADCRGAGIAARCSSLCRQQMLFCAFGSQAALVSESSEP